MSDNTYPDEGAYIEIVDTVDRGGEYLLPTLVRVNGTPLLTMADDPIIVHEIVSEPMELVKVTLTLVARRVEIKSEPSS